MKQWIYRGEPETSDIIGKRPEERSIEELLDFGIVVIDKPSGPTSHQVSAYVQKVLGIPKSGHSGTLDPKVTGVLPVATGRATRLLEFLLKAGKQYVGIMRLHDDIDEYTLRKQAEKFIGRITQLPPKRSAVARRNRKRTVYDFRFLEIRGRDILFIADVEAGTYIRKLCHDFGESLGIGAHMAELRRTRAAHYTEDVAITLQTLSDLYAEAKSGSETAFRQAVLPGETIVEHMPQVMVHDSAVNSLTHGATLKVPGIYAFSSDVKRHAMVALLTRAQEVIGIGTVLMSPEELQGDQGVAVKLSKVVMPEGTYPRLQ